MRTCLVQAYEITKRDWEFDRFVGIERIESDFIFEFRDDDCEAERVETGLEQPQFIRKRYERALLFSRYLLECRRDCGPYRHSHLLRS